MSCDQLKQLRLLRDNGEITRSAYLVGAELLGSDRAMSIATLCDECRISPRTLRRITATLEVRGFLRRIRIGRRVKFEAIATEINAAKYETESAHKLVPFPIPTPTPQPHPHPNPRPAPKPAPVVTPADLRYQVPVAAAARRVEQNNSDIHNFRDATNEVEAARDRVVEDWRRLTKKRTGRMPYVPREARAWIDAMLMGHDNWPAQPDLAEAEAEAKAAVLGCFNSKFYRDNGYFGLKHIFNAGASDKNLTSEGRIDKRNAKFSDFACDGMPLLANLRKREREQAERKQAPTTSGSIKINTAGFKNAEAAALIQSVIEGTEKRG